MVCAEAMACGCNVIASKNVGIHSQLISEKENGYLFEAGDVNSLTKLLGDIVKGKRKADNIHAFIVPGSKQVEKQAIEEGIAKIFEDAGFDWKILGPDVSDF